MSVGAQGLDPRALTALAASVEALRRHDPAAAVRAARAAAAIDPDHPEVLRRLALALSAQGPDAEAVDLIARAVERAPRDAVLANAAAVVLEANARPHDAVAALRRAAALAPRSADIACNLARMLSATGAGDESVEVLRGALERTPGHRAARIALAERLLQRRDGIDEAIALLRDLVRQDPADAWAWSALAEIEQARFDVRDVAALAHLRDAAGASFETQVRAGFALARARECTGDLDGAWAACVAANAAMRRHVPWDAAGFSRTVDAILAAFEGVAPAAGNRGEGVVFVVGLPRSGTSVAEQILSAHARVAAGGERLEMRTLIDEESARRGVDLAAWAPQATPADWERLGGAYLERVARERGTATVFTDKLPGNWIWLGAALAMLPGARVVDCRRDRLETAWGCFRRLFTGGGQDFSYDFESIARFLDDHERSMRHWHRLHGERIHELRLESLVCGFESELRRLLAFCGLPFDAACLRFHESARAVGTISASQVREPLRARTPYGERYGDRLDPLRAALGLPPFAAG